MVIFRPEPPSPGRICTKFGTTVGVAAVFGEWSVVDDALA